MNRNNLWYRNIISLLMEYVQDEDIEALKSMLIKLENLTIYNAKIIRIFISKESEDDTLNQIINRLRDAQKS